MSKRPRILLTHTPDMRRNYYGERPAAALAEIGDVVLHEGGAALDPAGLIAAARGCQIIVSDRQTTGPAAVFQVLPDLAAFVRVAVDIRNIDIAAASGAGVLVTQASRSWVPAVAELVVGLMIDVARGISIADRAYKSGAYAAGGAPAVRMGRQLSGSTAGLIGYGPLGRYVADLCLALGMRVVVHDPYVTVAKAGIVQSTMDEVVREADFLLPLAIATDETESLIDATRLRAMKPTAYLINLSRGNLIDEQALERALDERWIAGAALDVGRAPDQMPSPHLAAREDVVATPHMAGLTHQAIETMAMETVAQVAEIAAGRAPKGAVNADQASRLAMLRRP